MFSRISIKWILPPLLVLPVVFVASVLTWLAYSTGRESADDLASQSMHQIHSRIEEHLGHLLDMPPATTNLPVGAEAEIPREFVDLMTSVIAFDAAN